MLCCICYFVLNTLQYLDVTVHRYSLTQQIIVYLFHNLCMHINGCTYGYTIALPSCILSIVQ